jgi:hypothetical protein
LATTENLAILSKLSIYFVAQRSYIAYLFIGEFAMYRVFAQMKHNLNFDAFYLIKYPD